MVFSGLGPVHLAMGQTTSNGTSVTFTGTTESTQDALPGHSMHQAVVVLPARHDGGMWVGAKTCRTSLVI